jgi:hypothetical protein
MVNRKRRPVRPGASNVGDVTINTEGNLSLGVGSGLSVDTTDGSMGVQVGPVTIDTPDYGSSSGSSYGE